MFAKGSILFRLIFTSMLLLSVLLVTGFSDSARSASLGGSFNSQEAWLISQKSPTGGGGLQTGVISLAAADFIPSEPSNSFENHGRYLIHLDGAYATGGYVAQVTLPQGAVVTRFTVVFRDNSTSDLLAQLLRTSQVGNNTEMATVTSSGAYPPPSYGSKIDTTIQNATIDNTQYAYHVGLEMPESTPGNTGPLVWFTGASIQFLYPATAVNPSYYSLSAAALTPYQDGYSYRNNGNYLDHKSGPGGDITHPGSYWGRVQLPNGASVSSLTFYYYMDSNDYGVVSLVRSRLGYGNLETMAYLNLGSGSGNQQKTTTFIDSPIVDNSRYTYWVKWEIAPSDKPNTLVSPYFTVIQYAPPSSSSPVVPVSIPAAAFNAFEDGYDYQNDARYLQHLHDPWGGTNRGWYLAPVQIPQGARITQVDYYWHDHDATYYGIARLQRTNMMGNFEEMATLTSDGDLISGFYGKTEDTSISSLIIDNLYHAYWVVWDQPVWSFGDVRGCGMILYYTFPLYLPVVDNAP